MYFHVYLRQGTVYVPTVARTEAGFYMNVEPVAVVSVSNTDGIRSAFRGLITRGNTVIPTPKRNEYPPSLLPKYAGVETDRAFIHGTAHWAIDEKEGDYQIIGYRVHRDGYWVQDAAQKILLPTGSTAENVVEQMIAILEDAARRQSSAIFSTDEAT
jgi:hypothetical protein